MYLIGSIEILQQHFPNHDWDHARRSLDGTEAVIEKEIDADLQFELESSNVFCLTHQEALDYLNDVAMEGVWYTSPEPPSPMLDPNTQGGE